MLPRNDDKVRRHATMNNSDATILEKFRSDNPQLNQSQGEMRRKMG